MLALFSVAEKIIQDGSVRNFIKVIFHYSDAKIKIQNGYIEEGEERISL